MNNNQIFDLNQRIKVRRRKYLVLVLIGALCCIVKLWCVNQGVDITGKQNGVSLAATLVEQKTIYFSEYGDDTNDGLSQNSPKKDFTKYSNVDNVVLKFRCGETFVFDSEIDTFIVGSNVEITSYGEGEIPIISGYLKIDQQWVYESNCRYYISLRNYIQSQEKGNERINIGSLKILADNSEEKISFGRVHEKNLLCAEDDFYIDYANFRLYIYSNSKPTAKEYECARTGSCFTLRKENPNVSIHGIAVTGFSRHGICGTFKNVKIWDCHVYDIGGRQAYPDELKAKGWERMGNGIEVWGNGSKNVLIQSNYVDTCFDAGITVQASRACTSGAKDIEFEGNVVTNCYYLIEVFNHNAKNVFVDIEFHDNVLLYCNSIGYRKDYYSYSQLCIWSQAYKKGYIEIYDNLFAYTNQYTCYAYQLPDLIYCNVYDNTFVSDSSQKNEDGEKMIKSTNKIYRLENDVQDQIYVKGLIFKKLSEINMLQNWE